MFSAITLPEETLWPRNALAPRSDATEMYMQGAGATRTTSTFVRSPSAPSTDVPSRRTSGAGATPTTSDGATTATRSSHDGAVERSVPSRDAAEAYTARACVRCTSPGSQGRGRPTPGSAGRTRTPHGAHDASGSARRAASPRTPPTQVAWRRTASPARLREHGSSDWASRTGCWNADGATDSRSAGSRWSGTPDCSRSREASVRYAEARRTAGDQLTARPLHTTSTTTTGAAPAHGRVARASEGSCATLAMSASEALAMTRSDFEPLPSTSKAGNA